MNIDEGVKDNQRAIRQWLAVNRIVDPVIMISHLFKIT